MASYTQYVRSQLGLVAPSPKFEPIGAAEAQEKLDRIYMQLSLKAYLAARELNKAPKCKPAEPADYTEMRSYQEGQGYYRGEAAHMAFVAMQRR